MIDSRKRFIEGCNTIDLMINARTHREKEEIALVAMLDLDNKTVIDLRLDCKHAGTCKFTNCRNLLKKMIAEGLVQKNSSLIFQSQVSIMGRLQKLPTCT